MTEPTTPTDPRAALLDVAPRAVRAPYTEPDRTFDHLMAVDTEQWRRVVRLDREAALRDPLDGLDLTEYESRIVEWLAGYDVPTVGTIVALLWRARQAQPLAEPATVADAQRCAICGRDGGPLVLSHDGPDGYPVHVACLGDGA